MWFFFSWRYLGFNYEVNKFNKIYIIFGKELNFEVISLVFGKEIKVCGKFYCL